MVKIVSIFVVNSQNKLLALKSNREKFWQSSNWEIISGEIKIGENSDKAFERELSQKIGVENYIFAEKGKSYIILDHGLKRIIFPYFCMIDSEKIRINGDYKDFRWVTPDEFMILNHTLSIKKELRIFLSSQRLLNHKPITPSQS